MKDENTYVSPWETTEETWSELPEELDDSNIEFSSDQAARIIAETDETVSVRSLPFNQGVSERLMSTRFA